MPRRHFTPQELQELRELATHWGKIIARRAFGDDGPGLDIDLDTMEQIAQAAAAGLNEGTLQILLEQQAEALGDQQPCPDCGRLCTLRRHQRPLQVQGGQLHQREPLGRCRRWWACASRARARSVPTSWVNCWTWRAEIDRPHRPRAKAASAKECRRAPAVTIFCSSAGL